MESLKNIVSNVLGSLDFPLVVVDPEGRILVSSESAARLVCELDGANGVLNFQDLLAEPPASFPKWLLQASENTSVRLRQKNGNLGLSILVKAQPLAPAAALDDCWVLSLHQAESFSRQKYEREILLRIASVPIPEMTSEGQMLGLGNPDANPISKEMLTVVVRYLKGDAALLVRMDNFQRPSVIGQCGFSPADMGEVLKHFSSWGASVFAANGEFRRAAREGLSFSVGTEAELEPPLDGAIEGLATPPCEIWVDGIAGFGVAFIFFSEPPDHAVRQFATDAIVRLGRHLEATTYSNNMYEAFLELQKTQEQIIQSGKMAAIGELATGMAHELRQPITAINNFLTTILDHLEADRIGKIKERLDEYRTRFRRNMDRLSRIIDHLLNFGRQESLQFQPIKVRDFIEEILGTFLDAQFAKEGISIVKEIPDDLPLVEMDGSRMEQVVLNLISNARDALEGIREPCVTIRAETTGERFRLTVSDNGPGIPEIYRDKVFNPFFTTKPVGKGTGIGLSISHSIVKGHQGEIHIDSKEGGGASFTVEMPIVQPHSLVSPSENPQA